MRTRKRWRRLAGAFGLAAVLGAGLLWGATATGQLNFVATHGTSMAPEFHQGDLAVVRPSASYQVGDIVAYRSRLLDTVVLHRIVARDGDRYVFKGDNNGWLDKDQPTRADLIGALAVHVPRGGDAINWIRGRLLLLAALLVFVGGHAATATRRHRRKGPITHMPITARSRLQAWRGVTVGLGVAAALCASLGLAAYTRPATKTVASQARYTQSGVFDYNAAAPLGPVYETGKVSTGDPIYLRLVPALDITFAYTFTSRTASPASGTIALDAEVADGTGWTHRVQLQAATPFKGDKASATGRLVVADLQSLVAQVRDATGVQGGTPTVTVLADIRLAATIADAPVSERFAPQLQFQLDPAQMRLTRSTSDSGATTVSDSLRPHRNGTATQSRAVPAQLVFLRRSLAVATARHLGLLALPAALAALAGAVALRCRLRAESARIELRHGHRIIPVAGTRRDANAATVDVTTMNDLVRLAEQDNSLILHQQTDRGDVYLLETNHTRYRYTARPGSAAGRVSAERLKWLCGDLGVRGLMCAETDDI